MDAHFYNLNLTWLQDRKGEISSPDLNKTIEVATPPEFPKGMPGIWSPEHLYTAAVQSCFMTTFLAIAENSKLDFQDFKCNAKGKLEKTEGKFRMTEVLLEPTLTIFSETDCERAERILHKAEAACLITHSITASVSLNCKIKVVDLQNV